MTEPHSQNFDHDQLVAYLDGEVTEEERIAIEKRLEDDEEYRNRLVDLQGAWRILDRLPTAHADESFTRSTIAMVAIGAGSLESSVISPQKRNWIRAGLLTAAAVAGFLAIYVPMRLRDRAELLDLPLVHNIELYRYAEDIDFLKRLANEEDLFDDENEDVL